MGTINVSVTAFLNSGCHFYPATTNAKNNSKIKFKSVSGSTVAVYTYDSTMHLINAFKEQAPPYNARTGGDEYTLSDGVDYQTVILCLAPWDQPPRSAPSGRGDQEQPPCGSNGTINVGDGGDD